jgi:hypothetical protein|tara:strand:- start:1582 stop:1812 length:231 start_codon:yes stop_codon:yes gene_type:complete
MRNIKKYAIIILVFYLNSISALYAEKNDKKNNKNKIDFDWFNSEEYKMIKKMQNCKVKYLDGSFGTCNPYNSYRNP